MSNNTITRYEHETLERPYIDAHLLESLQEYYGKDGTPYFSLIHQGVKFNQYVGVLQVGDYTIEVLPKIDKADTNDVNWRSVLIQMLRMTSGIEAKATSQSQLNVQPNSIFELYVELFLKECERLTHRGLIKRYRRRKANRRALKGRLDISGQIRHNIVHKERFYVEYSAYEHDHLINQILKKTLIVLSRLPAASVFQNRIKSQLLYFEDVSDFIPTKATFDSIQYGRKNNHYRKAINIAKLILLNYHPDITRGQQDVLALMFDMNNLWEKYVAMKIREELGDRYKPETQQQEVFWESESGKRKRLKPDILLTDRQDEQSITVIDTKWKVPSDMKPSDEDLRQMFAYNRLFKSDRSVLLYPGMNESTRGKFQIERGGLCSLVTLQVIDNKGNLKQGPSQFRALWRELN